LSANEIKLMERKGMSAIAISGMLMVQINGAGSELSGSAGSLVSTLSPTDAAAGSDADPGAATSITASTATTPASMWPDKISPATAGGSSSPSSTVAGVQSPASNARTHDPNALENQDKTHWIEIQLVGEDGKGIPGELYRVTLPDGLTVAEGTLDKDGAARVEHIDAGTCQVTFPNQDRDSWEQV
jgi:hypothetical protein